MTAPFRRVYATIAPCAALAALLLTGLQAAAGEKINLDYDFYGNGIRVLTLGFDASVDGDRYTARSALKTKGLASIFSDGTTTSIATGERNGSELASRTFESRSKGSKGKRNVTVNWKGKGAPATKRSYDVAGYKRRAIDKVLEPTTPDPLSAMLQTTLFDADKPCQSSHRVYDGKQVFELNYRYIGRSKVKSSDRGGYVGPAYKCVLTYKPVAGLSKSKMKKAKQDPQPPFTVWMAPVHSPGLDRTLLIPVRAEGRMKWANLEIYLRKAKVAGAPLKPMQLAKN